ncbi:MAG: DUF998 domain-containing protein [Dermatophilaceae bacterium]
MTTDILLLAGVASAVLFVAVLFIEGATRAGYNPKYHTGSELQLGDRGWVQIANFVQMGVGTAAFAAGVYRVLGTPAGAVLLGVFALGMFIAGVMVPDPGRGYPPGSMAQSQGRPSWHHRIHHIVGGPVAFLAIFAACLTMAARLDGAWTIYSGATAAAGLGLTGWTAASYQKDAKNTGIVQRSLILVYWTWIAALGIHLVTYSQ